MVIGRMNVKIRRMTIAKMIEMGKRADVHVRVGEFPLKLTMEGVGTPAMLVGG